MSVRDTILRLDRIDASRDPEKAHAEADDLLLDMETIDKLVRETP